MFCITKKDNGSTKPEIYILRHTHNDAVAELLADFKKRNVASKTDIKDTYAGLFYEMKDDIWYEYNRTITITPAGYIWGTETTTATDQLVTEYIMMETSNKVHDNYKAYCEKKAGKYTLDEIKALPVGTIVRAKDKINNWYVAKIIVAYDSTTNRLGLHFNGFANFHNEHVVPDESRIMIATQDDVSKYKDTSKIEYNPYDLCERTEMRKHGLLLTPIEINNLKSGDYIDAFIGGQYSRKWTSVVFHGEYSNGNLIVSLSSDKNYPTMEVLPWGCAKHGTYTH